MVAFLTTGVRNFLAKRTGPENAQPTDDRREVYIAPTNTVADDQPDTFVRHRPKSRRTTYSFDAKHLCQAKVTGWQIMGHRRVRPLMGQGCTNCTLSRFMVNKNQKVETSLINMLSIYDIGPGQRSMFGYLISSLKFFYQLKNQEYKYIYDEVLEDDNVVRVISEAAQQACSTDKDLAAIEDKDSCLTKQIEVQQNNAKCILADMSSKTRVKNWVYKVVAWFTYYVVSKFATSLVVQPSQINNIREAEQSGLPVIYLPLHKSYMDDILLRLVLIVHNIKLPLVAVEENLRLSFLSKLLRVFGAFYIKSPIDSNNDQLYLSVLSSFIIKALKSGHHFGFFLENSRTQNGTCCVPKGDFLSILMDAYRDGEIEDAWIVPVSMSYDRLLEGNFVREQLGLSEKKETFFATLSTFIKTLCSNNGIMRVDFNIPYRLRDFYESIDKKQILENRDLGLDSMPENIRYNYTINGMAKHIIYDCWRSTAIMSTNAVSFLLLKKHRNGVTLEQLALDLSTLRDKLSQANRDVGFSGNSKDVVIHALSLMGPKLVDFKKEDAGQMIKPILNVPSLIELSYYGNSLLSYYLHQSIVALSLSKLVCPEFWNNTLSETNISRKKLVECCTFLKDLMQFDFVFIKPCDSLDNVVDTVIRHFEEEEIILTDMLLDEEKRGHNMAKLLGDDSDDDYYEQSYVEPDINYRVNGDAKSLNRLKFYRSIMMPYVECMAECAGSFIALPDDSVSECEHVQTILTQMQENLEEGILSSAESISVDTIKHSFLSFEKFNCLKVTTEDGIKTLSMIDNELLNLRPNMQNMSDYIEEFVKQIN